MDKKSEQVEQKEIEGQVHRAVPKVVLDVVALIFKRIEALILDFPPATPATDQGFDVFRSRLEIGNPAVGIGHFLGAVNRAQVKFWEKLKSLQNLAALQAKEEIREDGSKILAFDPIQNAPDLRVFGDLFDVE